MEVNKSKLTKKLVRVVKKKWHIFNQIAQFSHLDDDDDNLVCP